MTTLNISKPDSLGMPPVLRRAQRAIELPEVQAMLRRLSEFDLGIFMPHQHDEETGEFLRLADHVVQVESARRVSFQLAESVVTQRDRFPPVAWIWRAGAPSPAAVCEMSADETKEIGTGRNTIHKML